MNSRDVIIATQRDTILELEEQVRQLKKLLVPPFVTPAERHLTRKQKALFCMLLNRDLVTRDMLDAADITGASITPNHGNVILYQLRKKLKKFGFELKNEYGLGWRLVDRKKWQKRLAEAEAEE
ncbi:helix-turn-helix domain-containing protein [uncultured Bartonella sp.]|uniref:helix-turn-helix domain-containing protein n=1 Tax=uncultured Bartonella sp. TaxID=104108 RepID=UPI0025CE89B8|nr:helix-turn-helix domain-containing protein [uncultured Bartonella sp.]